MKIKPLINKIIDFNSNLRKHNNTNENKHQLADSCSFTSKLNEIKGTEHSKIDVSSDNSCEYNQHDHKSYNEILTSPSHTFSESISQSLSSTLNSPESMKSFGKTETDNQLSNLEDFQNINTTIESFPNDSETNQKDSKNREYETHH